MLCVWLQQHSSSFGFFFFFRFLLSIFFYRTGVLPSHCAFHTLFFFLLRVYFCLVFGVPVARRRNEINIMKRKNNEKLCANTEIIFAMCEPLHIENDTTQESASDDVMQFTFTNHRKWMCILHAAFFHFFYSLNFVKKMQNDCYALHKEEERKK